MTSVKLSTCEDTRLIEHVWGQWTHATNLHNRYVEWAQEHRELKASDFSAFFDAAHEFQDEIGMPKYGEPGRLEYSNFLDTWTLKLANPLRDPQTGKPIAGDRLTKCCHCGEKFITFNARERHCSDECKVAAIDTKKEKKAAERKAKLSARRDALASRKGLCMVCGTEFDLKRVTSRTCSAKCRQRLRRNPQDIQKVDLPGPTTVDLDFPELLPILRNQRSDLVNADIAAIMSGGQLNHDSTPLKELDARLAEEEHSWALHRLYAESPALAAWILKQPEQVQRDATGYGEAAIKLLGPDLYKRLSESR